MSVNIRSPDPKDVQISHVVGLETYKALYSIWPNLYTYISNPMYPKQYYLSLVLGVVASSGLTFEDAGLQIRNTLILVTNDNVDVLEEPGRSLVLPLIDSSYKIIYLKNTFWENVIWISVTVLLGFWIIWYLYAVGFWNYIFSPFDGVACYDCDSIFEKILNFDFI